MPNTHVVPSSTEHANAIRMDVNTSLCLSFLKRFFVIPQRANTKIARFFMTTKTTGTKTPM